jgi:arylsulfatase
MKSTIFLLSTLALPALAAKPQTPTNFVIINLDDVGYGDFSCNGALGYTTPNIDQMAADGLRFSHFLVGQAISGASRAGLLTGCYPNRIGFAGAPGPNCQYGIHPNEMTMGELVKQRDYATAIFGKWHLGDATEFLPLQNGFDTYYGLPYSNDMWPHHPQNDRFGFTDLPTMEGNKIIGYNTDQTQFTTDYTEKAVEFIKDNKKKPFFLYLAHSMPHVPLAVSDKFKGKSEQGLYGDVMMEIDWSVGQVLETLRKLGLEENTVVVLTSDNGPWTNYGNHAGSAGALRQGKATTFDGGNRVPCIVYWKGQTKPGTVCNKLTSNIDLFPTMAELSGAPLPNHKIDGVSLVPLIKGDEKANPRTSFVYYFNQNDLEAVTDGLYKLVFPHKHATYEVYAPGNDGMPGNLTTSEINHCELYDLRRDPGERYNIIASQPEKALELMQVAETMRGDLGDKLTSRPSKGARPHGLRK